jgi:VanZ family protein
MIRRVAVVWALALAVVMLLPSDSVPQAPGGDKLHHLVSFAVLGCVVALACPHRLIVAIGFAAIYGAVLEFLQPLTGRNAELGDVIADVSGTVLGVGLALLLIRAAGPVTPGTCRQATSRQRSRR